MPAEKLKRALFFIVVVLLLIAGAVLCWSIGRNVWGFFVGATDSIKAASIAAFVSVFTFLAGRYFEQSREIKSKSNNEKVRIYEGFFQLYFGLFSSVKPGGKPLDEGQIIQSFLEFQKELMLWGSDGVISAYLDFKDAMVRFDASKNEELPLRLAAMINSAARLLIEMRRDVGYRFTSVSATTLARLQLADPETDPDIKLVMKNLK